jgi:hypothetical protein
MGLMQSVAPLGLGRMGGDRRVPRAYALGYYLPPRWGEDRDRVGGRPYAWDGKEPRNHLEIE